MRSTIALFTILMIMVLDLKLVALQLLPQPLGTNFEMSLIKT